MPLAVMWKAAPRSADEPDQHRDLKRGQAERHGEVAEHEVGARDRRGQELALGAAVAVDDHAQPGEDAAQRDDEPDRSDAHERLVVDVRVQAAGGDLQRRGDDDGEQRRAEQRHERSGAGWRRSARRGAGRG